MTEQTTIRRFQAAARLLGSRLMFDEGSPRAVPFNSAYDAKVRLCDAFVPGARRAGIKLAPLIVAVYPTVHRVHLINKGPIRPESIATAKVLQRDFARYMDWLRLVQIWRLSSLYEQASASAFLKDSACLLGLTPLPEGALRSLVRSASHDPRADDSLDYGATWRFNEHDRVFPAWLKFARTSMKAINPEAWNPAIDP